MDICRNEIGPPSEPSRVANQDEQQGQIQEHDILYCFDKLRMWKQTWYIFAGRLIIVAWWLMVVIM